MNVAQPNVLAFEPVVLRSHPVAYVRTRHSATCKDAKKGVEWARCQCRKQVWFYYPDGGIHRNGGVHRTKRGKTKVVKQGGTVKETAGTRDWSEAETIARQFNDQFDPKATKIRQLEAEKIAREGEAKTVEQAIELFLKFKMVGSDRSIALGTFKAFQSVLGYVDQDFAIRRPGRLLKWVARQNPQPILLSDLTRDTMLDFRSAWRLNDRSIFDLFTRLKHFFDYCVERKWLPESPLIGQKHPKIKEGNRTGAFSDEEWIRIEMASEADCIGIKRISESDEEAQRLRAFLLLLRWTGMAIIDGVNFRQSLIAEDGSVTYKRRKTGKTARPGVLPVTAVHYIRTVPIDGGTAEQPFFRSDITEERLTAIWRGRLRELYKAAGIDKILTNIGEWKTPGAHQLRDTFAVGLIKEERSTRQVADALGDTEVMVQRHYAPWLNEREEQHKEDMRTANEAQVERLRKKKEEMMAGVGK